MLYKVTVIFGDKEKVECTRKTFMQAKRMVNAFVKYGGLFEKTLTECSIRLIKQDGDEK